MTRVIVVICSHRASMVDKRSLSLCLTNSSPRKPRKPTKAGEHGCMYTDHFIPPPHPHNGHSSILTITLLTLTMITPPSSQSHFPPSLVTPPLSQSHFPPSQWSLFHPHNHTSHFRMVTPPLSQSHFPPSQWSLFSRSQWSLLSSGLN